MKVKVISAISIALAVIGTSSALATNGAGTGGGQTTSSSAQPPAGGTGVQNQSTGYDERFLIDYIQSNRGEIQVAQAILAETSSTEVRNLANQLVTDHTQSLQQAEALADEKQIVVPNGIPPQHQRLIVRINAAGSAADADKFFVVGVIDFHQETVAKAAVYVSDGSDPQIRGFIQTGMPALVRHLALAVDTRAAVENDSTSLSDPSVTSSSTSGCPPSPQEGATTGGSTNSSSYSSSGSAVSLADPRAVLR